jgi:hypothetical protein
MTFVFAAIERGPHPFSAQSKSRRIAALAHGSVPMDGSRHGGILFHNNSPKPEET